ncbi:unnamed protein product [Cylindrotheca closterium]|uniref:G-protein coupled receptors family 1 profile domain-containing protein n=1 Tax=Cylindrotheca closterium TaxID=2856 RepID=A0AAD2FIP0_9STRA|nr:unnamed protein product [Cylindrotheca closterium]
MSSTTRLDSPVLYDWQINENSTRYDPPRSQLSEDGIQIQFAVLAFVNVVVSSATLVLILGILRTRKIRSNAFSLYLLFMTIPDFLGAFFCVFTCALSAPISRYYSEAMCGFQSFYLTFAFCGNAWINLVIVQEVNKLLTYSQNRRRYFPPTRQQVFCKVAVVYTYAAIWGLLGAFPIPGLPLQTKAYYGFACFPMEVDVPSTYFFYFAFLPGILMFPFAYSVFVVGRIFWKGMLPQAGKRRKLSIFLIRLISVYFFGWTPFLLLTFIGNFNTLSPWINWGGAAMSHFQGCISAFVVFYTSDDIGRQMKLVLRCNLSEGSGDPRQEASTYGRTSDTRISKQSLERCSGRPKRDQHSMNMSLNRSLSRSLDEDEEEKESEPRKAQTSTGTEEDGLEEEQQQEQDVESRLARRTANQTDYKDDL